MNDTIMVDSVDPVEPSRNCRVEYRDGFYEHIQISGSKIHGSTVVFSFEEGLADMVVSLSNVASIRIDRGLSGSTSHHYVHIEFKDGVGFVCVETESFERVGNLYVLKTNSDVWYYFPVDRVRKYYEDITGYREGGTVLFSK